MSVLIVFQYQKGRVKYCIHVFTKSFMMWMLKNRTWVTVTVLNCEGVQNFEFSESGIIL
jgi:hypothetical protein